MAIYYLSVKSFSRSAGRRGSRATSAAAYRSGERIRDSRTGAVYNHTQRKDVLHKEILLPERAASAGHAVDWARDRAKLWNAAEHAESRSNARVAREYTVALPFELDQPRQISLVRAFAHELAERYGCAVDIAIHAPRHDPRNFHAHLLTTTREITPDGLGAKTAVELSGTERYKRGLPRAADEFIGIRERWATLTNEALREANVAARVSHLGRDAQAEHQVLQPAEPTQSTIGLDRLERIQQEARLNWLQLRRQEMTKSPGSGREHENPLGVERDSAARPPDAEHEMPDNDVSL
jgi:ATP-dependent exoDNAse (exonuclease V) alpha subunit